MRKDREGRYVVSGGGMCVSVPGRIGEAASKCNLVDIRFRRSYREERRDQRSLCRYREAGLTVLEWRW